MCLTIDSTDPLGYVAPRVASALELAGLVPDEFFGTTIGGGCLVSVLVDAAYEDEGVAALTALGYSLTVSGVVREAIPIESVDGRSLAPTGDLPRLRWASRSVGQWLRVREDPAAVVDRLRAVRKGSTANRA